MDTNQNSITQMPPVNQATPPYANDYPQNADQLLQMIGDQGLSSVQEGYGFFDTNRLTQK